MDTWSLISRSGRRKWGDTVEGVPVTVPQEKKRLSFGEAAQWIRRAHVTPHLKTLQEAEISYNNWKR